MTLSKNAFLFAWNPIKFPWPEIGETIELLNAGEKVSDSWTCSSHKRVKPGDRAFFSRVGAEPRGIFGSGYVTSEPFIGKNHRGKEAYRVMVDFEVLIDPAKESILTVELLNMGATAKQLWTPQASGISIKAEVLEELEALWQDFLSERKKF